MPGAAGARPVSERGEEPTLLYSLVRVADGKTSEIEAKEDTPVLPGDVIKVKLAPTASQ